MNKQILEVVSAVSIEKDVDKEIIFEALEEAISSATKKLIGEMSLINVRIDRDTGDYDTFREWYTNDFQSFVEYNIKDVELV